MSTLQQLESELAEYVENVEVCNNMLRIEANDPDAKETKATLEALIAETKQKIAAQKAKPTSGPPPPPPGDDAPPPPPKYDMSKHPKFRKQSPEAPPPPPEDTATIFNVKDIVSAKYSEDKQWYTATIVSRTGSSTDPVYTVTFKGYGNTETKRKHEIRPVSNDSKKRKADGPPVATLPPPPPSPHSVSAGHVISAEPAVNPSAMQQKREPSKVSDGPVRMQPEPKKLKGKGALEKGKANWQAFSASGPKKAGPAGLPKKKDSMFRTPDLPNAKVGFTGSGKPMQKDQARAKWQFKDNGQLDE